MNKADKYSYFGSVYSRNPQTGEKSLYGYLFNFNNDDVLNVKALPKKVLKDLEQKLAKLEKKVKFVAEIFITYSPSNTSSQIYLEKAAKLNSIAYPKVLIDLLTEKIINEKELLQNIPLDVVKEWYSNSITNTKEAKVIAKGEVISYGASSGRILYKVSDVAEAIADKKKVIWVLREISTQDIKLFNKVSGLILTQSGATSHAAVIAKGLGIPAVIGGNELLAKEYLNKEITVDANTGKVYSGALQLTQAGKDKKLQKLIDIAKKHSKIRVTANADNGQDAQLSIDLGAEGIGLCRTEHMFTSDERANLIREILFKDEPSKEALEKLLKIQTEDFLEIFRAENKKEIIVRYLDAPLHEFSHGTKIKKEENPMLGFRGVRMLIKKPEIIKVQTRAIFNALFQLKKEKKSVDINLEVPLTIDLNEVAIFRNIVEEEIKKLDPKKEIKYKIGTMIETPRAAMLIEKIAPLVDFISYGTNDLTQMLCGISRDDTAGFMDYYIEKRILPANPFNSLDIAGVGEIIKTTSDKAKKVNPKIKISLCGEQGGDSESIKFILGCNIDAVSCSPARVPLAIFAAGKYSIK